MSGGSYDYPKKSLAHLVVQMFSPGSWSGDFSASPLALSVPPPRPWAHHSILLFSHPYNSPCNMSVILRPVPWTSGIVFGKHARGGRYSVQARNGCLGMGTVLLSRRSRGNQGINLLEHQLIICSMENTSWFSVAVGLNKSAYL